MLRICGGGHSGELPVLQMPDNAVDAVSCDLIYFGKLPFGQLHIRG